jgi:hypothetical protein
MNPPHRAACMESLRPFMAACARSVLALCVSLSLFVSGCGSGSAYQPQEGDVVFQSLAHNPLIDAIEGATDSPFSHCGILHRGKEGWMVIEAIGPVKETPLAEWIAQGREKQYTAFRLREKYRPKIPEFVKMAQTYEGRPYDIHYDMDDEAIYCSELVYKSFLRVTGEEMGHLQMLGELQWMPYAGVIQQIEGGKLPLERKMITPRSLSEATQLEKVFAQ